ncbi:uncharacterized protein LY89DRAFT_681193 [Mollisia scopiformis]|uniref:Uncharacterized protein n=1 Tax=Mollisia scopiformis TaxID=149040 RepID=A0A194XNP9_MOLSC|nr:uncharacterized protein LY89DRAFT_681193 [Mollisia scopiformis]KUJ21798.1 hypothetical protein LY89DRAFT_681193 [Mollisia scopiformis]
MIDPSQYRQIGFVVRSDLSKKIQSFAELITASQALRKAWKRFMLPTSQQCMKYRSTDHADIRIFRHNRTSLLRAGDDHGFRQLQKLFSLQDSALVISGSDGLTRDRDELCRFLASFENDTMMYFFDGDNFRRRFKSRDLASRLNPLTSQRQQSTDIQSFAKYLDVLKRIEKVYVSSSSSTVGV